MPEVCSQPTRPRRRITPPCRPRLVVRPVWPSSFTSRPHSDAWIDDEGDGILTLHVGDGCMAVIQGLPLDQQSMNLMLDKLRQRPPLPRR